MTRWPFFIVFTVSALQAHAGILQRGKVQLICHRTANRDVPENTLESLGLAARMGCNIVEVDIRTTLDGVLVLNHDGYLERLTDGMGDVESATFDELGLYDYGGWMAARFSPMRIPRFTDALHLAREQGIGLALDIKQKGEGPAIYAALREEGMLERVTFGGEDGNADDLRALYPAANEDAAEWIGPVCDAAQVETLHAKGKFVVANFSANKYEMDQNAMRAAVIAGVDAINVDYPRIGADAVGRPVERKIATLAAIAFHGTFQQRIAAMHEILQYQGFPTQAIFTRLLYGPDIRISRAAAVALVIARPATPVQVFVEALSAPETSARQSAAWALGITHAAATADLLRMLTHSDVGELKEVLLALSRCPGDVPADVLLPFLSNNVPVIRAAAALALVKHQPQVAVRAVPELLRRDEQRSATAYAAYVLRGKPKLTQAEIDPIVEEYREHMKLIQALEMLPESQAFPLLATEAFRSAADPSHVTSLVAGYGLWDRIDDDPALAIRALDSLDVEVADRAEWMLVKGSPAVLPAVRAAIHDASPKVRMRLIHVLAWKGDRDVLPLLNQIEASTPEESELIQWATQKIMTLQFSHE